MTLADISPVIYILAGLFITVLILVYCTIRLVDYFEGKRFAKMRETAQLDFAPVTNAPPVVIKPRIGCKRN